MRGPFGHAQNRGNAPSPARHSASETRVNPLLARDLSPYTGRGEAKPARTEAFPRRIGARVFAIRTTKERGGAPKGASIHVRAAGTEARHRRQVYAVCALNLQDALAFRRSTAALIAASERRNSAQAVLHTIKRTRALPAGSIALKRSTPRAGHSAGGNDA